ncbi:MAG: type II CAAX endopeptidase family protein [Deltaproteobacteria bacterium]|nr:type II CAAX endopeptidase family protein [Deltaproteobacteria bacterium]
MTPELTPTFPVTDPAALLAQLGPEPFYAAGLGVVCLLAFAVSGRLRCLREEFANLPRRAAALLLLWVVLVLTVFYPTIEPGDAAAIDPETLWFPALFTTHLVLVGFLLLWWALAYPQPLLRFIRLETATPPDLPLGLQVGAIGWAAAMLTSGVVAMILAGIGWDGGSGATLGDPFDVPPLLLWLAELPLSRKLLVIFVAMTVEEAFYRGFLQPRIGWIPSSILFALSHAGYGLPTLMASVFTVSLALGWAFRRTGSLLPCIVAHGFFDAVQLLIIMPFAVEQLRGASG